MPRTTARRASSRDWFESRDEMVQVLHPALKARRAMRTGCACAARNDLAAGLFSVVFDERFGSDQVDQFCDSLKLFKLGYSWGGPISLVVPYDIGLMRDASVAKWPHKGTLVRFSIGLEDVADLQHDLEAALGAL